MSTEFDAAAHSTLRRREIVAERAALIGLVAYEAEHREEMRRLEIAGRARHLACKRLLGCNAVDRRRKELERRRESDRVALGELLLGQLPAIEIDHLARAEQVELQHLEIGADVVRDRLIGEVHQMRLAAIGTAAQLRSEERRVGKECRSGGEAEC